MDALGVKPMNPRARRLRRQRRTDRRHVAMLLNPWLRHNHVSTYSDPSSWPTADEVLAGITENASKFIKLGAGAKADRAKLEAFIGARIRESLSGSVADPNANTEATRQAVREHVASFLATLPERPACNVTDIVFDPEAGTITTSVEVPAWLFRGRLMPSEEA